MAYKNKNDAKEYAKKWYIESKNKKKNCSFCNKSYITRYKNQIYCSIKCAGTSRSKKHTCLVCKNLFYAPPSKNRIYCSHKCAANDPTNKKIKKLKMINRWISGEFEEYDWSGLVSEEIRKKIGKLTSIRQLGANNSQWKGGITSVNRIIRTCSKYKEWRFACMKRDLYACQECGTKRVYLEVDHIIPFGYILKKYNIITLEEALACRELWDINNGKTLCKSCHKKTPTYARNINYTLTTS